MALMESRSLVPTLWRDVINDNTSGWGTCFTSSATYNLVSVQFLLSVTNSMAGGDTPNQEPLVLQVWDTLTEAPGTGTANVSGSPIATVYGPPPSSMPNPQAWVTFYFDTPISMVNGSHYCFGLRNYLKGTGRWRIGYTTGNAGSNGILWNGSSGSWGNFGYAQHAYSFKAFDSDERMVGLSGGINLRPSAFSPGHAR